jgi:hypothetical protein
MRPNDVEILRLLESVILELGQEVPSLYGKAQAQLAFMLLETVAAGLDEAAHYLYHDIQELRRLLGQVQEAIARVPQDHPRMAPLTQRLAEALAQEAGHDLRLHRLEALHRQLMGSLEVFLCLCEEVRGDPRYEPLMPLQAAAYDHLRRAAVRGWTFWDALSFRERILKERETLAQRQ